MSVNIKVTGGLIIEWGQIDPKVTGGLKPPNSGRHSGPPEIQLLRYDVSYQNFLILC